MLSFFSKSKKIAKQDQSQNSISSSLKQIFTHKTLSKEMLEELEDCLISADIGVSAAQDIVKKISQQKFVKDITVDVVKEFLVNEIAAILKPYEKNIDFNESKKPQVIVFNGVNGSGKTTTIGKISSNLKSQNKKVLIAACDSFRAAAVEQLEVWAKRANCNIILPKKESEDPAAIAYRAMKEAAENDYDILLIDTAGRLQNKQNLMDELKKISTVIKKIDITAPHENILVIDSTVGQNSYSQLEIFDNVIGVTGLVATKFDGSAKGGVLVGLVQKFNKPIYAVGVGEKIEDLQEFNAKNFSQNLLGI